MPVAHGRGRIWNHGDKGEVLLGEQLRGVQFDFSDLRGNFERLLDQLEDAVLMFGRDRRLVVASGAVEKFWAACARI